MTAGITALLGPTNTGKTHHAIERMLEHPTGMIGLPLRLLAREVYDKITAKVGESRVALVTGEEQRVPRRPAYWVATVEAMPVQHDVDFLAVDEIQLSAHAQRGHVFTSRLLHARGRLETWFLGAGTMRNALRELVPHARQVEHPRLSSLRFAGAVPLARLPPRSAVVAFSMPHVYEIADRLRRRRGGAAIVLGALSPRTRNAQVAMFQAGEVDCLVATDAIGMGLNLGVEHVAFAAARKFDGRDLRDLDAAELGQIAGRAGRWVHDGTFGTVTPLALPLSVAQAIETHAFSPVRRVQWRSDDLDYSSLSKLRESLAEPPTRGIFRHAAGADDALCLNMLATRDDVRGRAHRSDAVRMLWDVCTIPDFRKLMLEVHADFLESVFIELIDHGVLRDDWIERHVRELERGGSGAKPPNGADVEELVARIAAVRTWTYVANRTTWLSGQVDWEARTRALEDRLSDSLHERLVARFVDAKKKHPILRSGQRVSPRRLVDEAPPADPSHPFAKLATFRPSTVAVAPPADSVSALVEAEHAAFELLADGAIIHDARIVGRVTRGASIAQPAVRLVLDDLGAGAKSQVQRRLQAYVRDVVGELVGGIGDLATKTAPAPLRGFVHRLEQGLGTALESDLADVLSRLDSESKTALEDSGILFARGIVYLESGLAAPAIAARIALSACWFGAGRGLLPPNGGAVSFVPSRGFDRAAYTAIGYPVIGPRAIRADVLARLFAAESLEAADAATWIGAPVADTRRVLAQLA
jgi:ATP-dependent RNA helicase SUPV3L1/SUV3